MFPCSFIILASTARILVLSGDIFYVSFSIILFLFQNAVSVDWNVLPLITKFQSKGNRKVCLPTLTLASLPIELTQLKQSTAHKSRSTNSSTTGTWRGFIRRLLCGNFWCKEEEVEAETSCLAVGLKLGGSGLESRPCKRDESQQIRLSLRDVFEGKNEFETFKMFAFLL